MLVEMRLFLMKLLPFLLYFRYPIHSPFVVKSDKDLQGVWAETENAKESGKARSIGVSNFRQRELEAVLKTARIIPAINQIEYHPYLEHGDTVLLKEKRGIRNVAYDPLPPATTAKGGPLDGILAGLAKKYAVTEVEVLLRWCIDRGAIAITTSSKRSRLMGYICTLQFSLTPAEIGSISGRFSMIK
ncbi:NADPH-dependent alpha-keto amide reductase [Histoplasma capsulatum var. duboisii H88]|uniref:NADPH-dependent alpha-keto amide reductase n=1 Tax=Ajellomyces capsulatus (strain H88) TaxID=544711 RepID=A0A8A1LJX1_AJEC8|nr:NADPH-dependent alpha-keto amide reductase [Histoplasma capsulatum var. duboisii H88]